MICSDAIPSLLLQQVDDVLRALDVACCHGRRLLDDVLAGHRAGDHNVGAVGPDHDRLARKQLRQVFFQGIEIPSDDEGLD